MIWKEFKLKKKAEPIVEKKPRAPRAPRAPKAPKEVVQEPKEVIQEQSFEPRAQIFGVRTRFRRWIISNF